MPTARRGHVFNVKAYVAKRIDQREAVRCQDIEISTALEPGDAVALLATRHRYILACISP
jgi:hypothetical protein